MVKTQRANPPPAFTWAVFVIVTTLLCFPGLGMGLAIAVSAQPPPTSLPPEPSAPDISRGARYGLSEASLRSVLARWPVSEAEVVRGVDIPERPWQSGHRGLDIGSHNAAAVLAPAGGAVSFAGLVVNRMVLTIDHGNGVKSSLMPVTTSLEVGDTVQRGEVVGSVQSIHAGCPVSWCVHWGVRVDDAYIDPRLILEHPVMQLKPVGGSR